MDVLALDGDALEHQSGHRFFDVGRGAGFCATYDNLITFEARNWAFFESGWLYLGDNGIGYGVECPLMFRSTFVGDFTRITVSYLSRTTASYDFCSENFDGGAVCGLQL